jgi:hypothetical protein
MAADGLEWGTSSISFHRPGPQPGGDAGQVVKNEMAQSVAKRVGTCGAQRIKRCLEVFLLCFNGVAVYSQLYG